MQFTYKFQPKPTTTSITIGEGILPDFSHAVVVIDEALKAPRAKKVIRLPGGEALKTRAYKEALEDQLLGPETELVVIGGGTLIDLAGFTAATYFRGIPLTVVPTTLLAMVDAAIGGKNAINSPISKNGLGTIYQPKEIVIDLQFLKTLPEKEWQNGRVEMFKHSLLSGDFEERPLSEMIRKNIEIKLHFIESNRDLLNFGHTIGHAIELLENFQISHGEAVMMGLLAESKLSGIEIESFIHPLEISRPYSIDEWHAAVVADKKTRLEKPQIVVFDSIGNPKGLRGFTKDELEPLYHWMNDAFSSVTSKR